MRCNGAAAWVQLQCSQEDVAMVAAFEKCLAELSNLIGEMVHLTLMTFESSGAGSSYPWSQQSLCSIRGLKSACQSEPDTGIFASIV
ncbi:hypothetical protein UY3_00080 [Chelonia mydas]|uniref:Uncharacterized protein n=1 Tax=Chelonia mydas TaxID=8469 RepID=M7C329_CHEMY|nr:hypothetical protein UY3_00080 [Chelonia mydas]